MSQMTPRTISSRSTQASVVTSPATIATPVLTSVSQATRARLSCASMRVEHGVGNLVGDLVRVAFGDGFGGEQVTV